MTELEFGGLDHGRLLLLSPEGDEAALEVTDELRAAVCPQHEAASAEAAEPGPESPESSPAADRPQPALKATEVQARLRAGVSVYELVGLTDLSLSTLKKLEWPINTEREHIISLVREHQVTGLFGSAELGEIADGRLATRGIEGEAEWTARREGSAPWVVEVRFVSAGRDRCARWTFDPRGQVVTALDDEARWLSQPNDPLTPEVKLTSTGSVPAMRSSNTGAIPLERPVVERPVLPPVDAATESLLDDLAARRGTRPADSMPFERPATGEIPARAPGRVARTSVSDLVAGAPRHPAFGGMQPTLDLPGEALASVSPIGVQPVFEPVAVPDEEEPPTLEGDQEPATEAPAKKKKGGRAPMPSWDDILLGSRP